MGRIYQSVLFRISLYYLVGAIAFPLVYAVTNQLRIHSVFTFEWLTVIGVLYFIFLFMIAMGIIFRRVVKNIVFYTKNIGRKIPE